MKFAYFLLLNFTFLHLANAQQLTDYVDPLMCTAGDRGQLDPSASMPFGMMKAGPDTDPINHGGYNYNAGKIFGFSHLRTVGTGCKGAGGNLRIKPGVGKPDAKSEPYIKSTEKASVGYYGVAFENGIKAEIGVDNRTAFHTYTFPATSEAYLLFDFQSSYDQLVSYEYSQPSDTEIMASISAKNVCGKGQYNVHFYIKIDRTFEFKTVNGKLYGLFSTGSELPVRISVTASPISALQAKEDFKATGVGVSQETIVKLAQEAWEKLLSRVEVQGKEEYKKIFYTHLYHAYLSPFNTLSATGNYKGTDGKVYEAKDYIHYDSWSIWDTYRTKLPLITLLEPDISADISRSLLDLYRTGKQDWSGKNEPVPTVRTEHAGLVLLDSYVKGVKTDLPAAYKYFAEESDKFPWVSPDNKLESAYDFWALSEMARLLKKTKDSEYYLRRSQEYKTGYRNKFVNMTPWSDIMHGDGLYEGTIWQYRWAVPFDVDGIMAAMGGKEIFSKELNYFFDNDLYNHGNEPDMHATYLFNKAGEPQKTQYWINRILTKPMNNWYGTHHKNKQPEVRRIYTATPDGYIDEMDDDDGTMSAWYVFSAMGFYPLTVGKPEYEIGSPIFEKITIRPDNGKAFVIETEGFSDKAFYIQSATLNGKPLSGFTLKHADIIKGGTLKLIMKESPPRAQD